MAGHGERQVETTRGSQQGPNDDRWQSASVCRHLGVDWVGESASSSMRQGMNRESKDKQSMVCVVRSMRMRVLELGLG